jgi:hypothetical protein
MQMNDMQVGGNEKTASKFNIHPSGRLILMQ